MKGKWLIAGGLILAELALCAAIVAVLWGSVAQIQAGAPQIRFGGFGANLVSAKADEEKQLTVDGPAVINVNKGGQAAFGNVTVIGGPGDEVVITAHKTAWGANEAEAQADLAQLKVVVTQNKNTIEVRVDRPQTLVAIGNDRPDTVDFVITTPVESSAYLETDYGDLSVSGTQGDAHLDTNFGKVSVTDVKGGNVNLRSDFGELTLDDVEADEVEAHSNAGTITLKAVTATGEVTLDSDFGEIKFESGGADSLAVKTNSGGVILKTLQIEKTATAETDFGAVTLTGVAAGAYDLDSNSGDISVTGASGPVKAHTDFGNVTVSEAEAATLDLSTNSGEVNFAGSLGPGPHTLKSNFGNVRLRLPEESALDVDLETNFGVISSDLPLTLSGEQEKDHRQGVINGGGANLTAKTNSGNISIEILKP